MSTNPPMHMAKATPTALQQHSGRAQSEQRGALVARCLLCRPSMGRLVLAANSCARAGPQRGTGVDCVVKVHRRGAGCSCD